MQSLSELCHITAEQAQRALRRARRDLAAGKITAADFEALERAAESVLPDPVCYLLPRRHVGSTTLWGPPDVDSDRSTDPRALLDHSTASNSDFLILE